MTGADERAPQVGEAAGRRRVLVSLPGSGAGAEEAHAVIAAGRVIAEALGAPLHGLLAWPTAITPAEVPRLLQLEAAVLDGLVLDVGIGDPAACLCAATRTQPVAFVVIAAVFDEGEPSGLSRVASHLIAEAQAGAVVVRPGNPLGRIRRILVPIDGTPSTAAALSPAGELARCAGAALDVVMIEDAARPLSAEPGAMATPRYVDQPQHEWPAFSAELVRRLLSAVAHWPPAVPTRFLLGTGRPADEIHRFAVELEPDLIALVWHCAASPHGLVFREVVRRTSVPLLVLRR